MSHPKPDRLSPSAKDDEDAFREMEKSRQGYTAQEIRDLLGDPRDAVAVSAPTDDTYPMHWLRHSE